MLRIVDIEGVLANGCCQQVVLVTLYDGEWQVRSVVAQ